MAISIKKIARRRAEIGMSVSEFAKRLGISRKTYYDWENGLVPVLDKYEKMIAGVLRQDVNDISEEDMPELPESHLQTASFDLSEIKKRIQWAFNYIITEYELSNVKLARTLGLSTSTVDSYRRGIKMPKLETFAFIQNSYKISLDWIINGRGDKFIDGRYGGPPTDAWAQYPAAHYYADPDALPADEFVFVPQMVGTARNGALAPDGATELRIAFRRDWIARKGLPQNMTLIKVQGDSMEPTLLTGDLVMVDESVNAATRGGLFAITMYQEILIRRIQPLMDSKLLVISDNQKYTTIEINAEDIHINGKVIWFARELER